MTDCLSQMKKGRHCKKPPNQGIAVPGSRVTFTVALQAFRCARSCLAIYSQSWRCECSKAVVSENRHSSEAVACRVWEDIC